MEGEKDLALFPLSHTESEELWTQVYVAICDEFKPITSYQLILCHQLAVCEWRKLRMVRHETSRIRRDQTLAKNTQMPKTGTPHLPDQKLSMQVAEYELKLSKVASGLRREIEKLARSYWEKSHLPGWLPPHVLWQDKWLGLTRKVNTFNTNTGVPDPLSTAIVNNQLAH